MAGVVLFVTALAISAFLGEALLGYLESRNRHQSPVTEADILQQVAASELQVDAEFTKARAAMNDAAGQSWRNLAG